MRDLLPIMEAGLWARFSVIFFLVVFVVIVFLVYRPSVRNYLEGCGRMPVDEE